jgi:hypothetical protein
VFHDPEIAQFDSRYLTTAVPAEYLWGPGPAADARAWLELRRPEPDAVDTIDQLMLIRHHGHHLYLPQRPDVVAASAPHDLTGRWHLVLADHPMQAFTCIRARINRQPGHLGNCTCATKEHRPRLLAHHPAATGAASARRCHRPPTGRARRRQLAPTRTIRRGQPHRLGR